jgi:betaine-aldehyde dehydrogenase
MTSWMRREPLGVVSAVVPWNFPLMMAVWKVAPILAAGNTCVLKPAPQTPASALRLAELAAEAGLPRGVLNVVCGDATTGRLLIADSRPAAVAFTGSVQAGREVAATAAATLKRTHLELGGKAPAVVLEDLRNEKAMLDKFLHRLCGAALFNAGQSCTAAARIIAVGSVYDEVVTGMQKWSELVSVGPDGDCGPLISEDHLNRVDGYVARRGGHTSMVTGGRRVDSKGFYYTPTVIADVRRSDELAREEVFGPVITIERADTEADAVAAANDSVFGLAASAWTLDQRAALRLSQQLTAGDVWINSHGMQAAEMPHGGCKQSGYGSDLSIESILGYTRCVHVASWWE